MEHNKDLPLIFSVTPAIKAMALAKASSAPNSSINSWEASKKSFKASEFTDLKEVAMSLAEATKMS